MVFLLQMPFFEPRSEVLFVKDYFLTIEVSTLPIMISFRSSKDWELYRKNGFWLLFLGKNRPSSVPVFLQKEVKNRNHFFMFT